MKDMQNSTTALGIAAMRAIESEKAPEERFCYDPYSRKFASILFYLTSKIFDDYASFEITR
jgi:O-methyltransferase involved in polyketide biosynthesis